MSEELSPKAAELLAGLPSHLRPTHLPVKFPRIFDDIAQLWAKPEEMRRRFEELMLHRRSDQLGFPEEVAVELMALQKHYLELYPPKAGIWDYAAALDPAI